MRQISGCLRAYVLDIDINRRISRLCPTGLLPLSDQKQSPLEMNWMARGRRLMWMSVAELITLRDGHFQGAITHLAMVVVYMRSSEMHLVSICHFH